MENRLEKIKVHFFYCTVILTLVIIAVATDRWTLQPNFTEFLSNAATMTSLVLGLVAIFYSFIANDGLSKSLGSIGTVSQEVRVAREEISRQVALGAETTNSAERSTQLIERASKDIEQNLAALSQTLSSIQHHTTSLHGSLGNLPGRIDELETKLIDATKGLGTKITPPAASSSNIDAEILKRFLQRSSLSCDLLVYACILAHKTDKVLTIEDFCSAVEINVPGYMTGFLDCMDSLTMVSAVKVNEGVHTFKITHIDSRLEASEEYFTSYLESNFKNMPDKLKRWNDALERVKKIFI